MVTRNNLFGALAVAFFIGCSPVPFRSPSTADAECCSNPEWHLSTEHEWRQCSAVVLADLVAAEPCPGSEECPVQMNAVDCKCPRGESHNGGARMTLANIQYVHGTGIPAQDASVVFWSSTNLSKYGRGNTVRAYVCVFREAVSESGSVCGFPESAVIPWHGFGNTAYLTADGSRVIPAYCLTNSQLYGDDGTYNGLTMEQSARLTCASADTSRFLQFLAENWAAQPTRPATSLAMSELQEGVTYPQRVIPRARNVCWFQD